VPRDVAIVDFDNSDVMALASRPTLTSVDMNLRALGRVPLEVTIEGRGATSLGEASGRALLGIPASEGRGWIQLVTAQDDRRVFFRRRSARCSMSS
jgi:hypothetical protein